jgi:hypothetical protein
LIEENNNDHTLTVGNVALYPEKESRMAWYTDSANVKKTPLKKAMLGIRKSGA